MSVVGLVFFRPVPACAVFEFRNEKYAHGLNGSATIYSPLSFSAACVARRSGLVNLPSHRNRGFQKGLQSSGLRTRRRRGLLPRIEQVEPRLFLTAVTVTTVADTLDYPATVTISQLNIHQVSLRDAMTAANNTAGTDTLKFAANVFDTITLNSALPVIKTNMSIVGPGARTLTINVNQQGSGFLILAGVTAEIDGLNILLGKGTFDPTQSRTLGGGILNHGTLTLRADSLGENSADEGGGVYSNGILTVANCEIGGNTAGSYGGGILAEPAPGKGPDTLTVYNSTFYLNDAHLSGGAVRAPFGVVAITDCTITRNTCDIGEGSGIEVATSDSALLQGTISAGNTAPMGGVDIDGGFAGTYNLIGKVDAFGAIPNSAASHNLLGTIAKPIDPLLESNSEFNNGTTGSFLLLPGSPAIDAGATFNSAPNAPITTDQRGVSRPRGAAPDIGSFESRGFTLTPVNNSGKQSRLINQPFADLTVQVVSIDSMSNFLLDRGVVTFTTTTVRGATAILSKTTAVIDNLGFASVKATANGLPGTYTVTASAKGVALPAVFTLTNLVKPFFSALSSPTVASGTPSVNLSGKITAGIYIPSSGVVTIAVGALRITATINSDGTFSNRLAINTLRPGTYAISYSFPGIGVFTAATGAGTLKVILTA